MRNYDTDYEARFNRVAEGLYADCVEDPKLLEFLAHDAIAAEVQLEIVQAGTEMRALEYYIKFQGGITEQKGAHLEARIQELQETLPKLEEVKLKALTSARRALSERTGTSYEES